MKLPADIPYLISKKILNDHLRPEEEERLEEWLKTESNRCLFEKISQLELAAHIWKLERERYGEHMAARFRYGRRKLYRRRIYRQIVAGFIGAAAFFLLVMVFPLLLPSRQDIPTPVAKTKSIKIIPGETKATLTLNDGQAIAINESNKNEVSQLLDSVRVASEMVKKEKPQITYSTLNIPKGGDFFYQLSDSTKVWLNSESELRFPEKFTGNERRVYLKGEAFFDVADNGGTPFVVSTEQGDVCAYGTRFNITHYKGSNLSTVLVEGRVGVRTFKNKEVMLRPSERLVYNDKTNQIRVETVDVSPYIAWVDKHFFFSGQTLEEIMTTLSRWYNFNFVFTDESLRTIRLSGRLYRYDDIRILLESYRQTAGINFRLEEHNIIITK